MSACPAIAYGDAFAYAALNAADCHARAIASLGYQALAAPGSSIALLLTGLLTLFVAFYGYRMMLGETPGVREGVLALAKIALVLALATSWATYRTLAYDLVFGAPTELVADVGGAAGLPGSAGDMALRLQAVDRGLVRLGEMGVGNRESDQKVMRVRNIGGRSQTLVENASEPVNIVEPIALSLARVAFLVSAVGGLIVVRLIAGILLALGPLFVMFLLFDTTRGWFAGWLRGLAGTMIGTFGIALLIGIELALTESWIAGLLSRRAAEQEISGAPVELLATMLIFGLAIVATLAASARVAGGFRFPEAWRSAPERVANAFERQTLAHTDARARGEPAADRPRAAAVADAVVATQRREAAIAVAIAGGAGSLQPPRVPGAETLARDLPQMTAPPLGQSPGRRTRTRASASSSRRDSRS